MGKVNQWVDEKPTARLLINYGFLLIALSAVYFAWSIESKPLSVAVFLGGIAMVPVLFQQLAEPRATHSQLIAVLSKIFEDCDDPVLCLDRDCRVLFANLATVKKLGNRLKISDLAELGNLGLNARQIALEQQDLTLIICATENAAHEFSFPLVSYGGGGEIIHKNKASEDLFDRNLEVFKSGFGSGRHVSLSTAHGHETLQISRVENESCGVDICLNNAPPDAVRPIEISDIPMPLMIMTPGGDIEHFNARAAELVGYALHHAKHLSEVVDGPGRPVCEWLREANARQVPLQPEVVKCKLSEDERFLHMSLTNLYASDGAKILVAFNDATELKSLEAQVVQSQKMQAIGQLAGGVAHDFNNLLTAIRGYCDLLLMRHTEGSADYADLVQILDNSNRAAHLVRQLLAFSRKQTLRPQNVEVEDVLSDLTHLLNRLVGEQIELNVIQSPDLGHIRIDRNQLEQVIVNLVVNARDAITGLGSIEIVGKIVHIGQREQIQNVPIPAGDYVLIRVKDSGSGITPEKQKRIFEPFFTTKPAGQGTGLGLSMVYGIVKQSGGYVFVESDAGSGAEFFLYFPKLTSLDRQETIVEDENVGEQSHLEGTILIVEDEAPVRTFACRALSMKGHGVLEASNGVEALEIVRDQDIHVDIIITDVIMPQLDGPAWVKQARALGIDTPVIFMSGYSDDLLDTPEHELGPTSFLSKPFTLEQLASEVSSRLNEARGNAKAQREEAVSQQ